MISPRTLLTLAVLAPLAMAVGCGPSPAMEPATPVRAIRVPADRVVAACPCEDDDCEGDEAPVRTPPVEYVRIDEWQAPPSVKEIEARIEPRGDKAPDYVRLPRLTMHREIAPTTSYRRLRYWR